MKSLNTNKITGIHLITYRITHYLVGFISLSINSNKKPALTKK